MPSVEMSEEEHSAWLAERNKVVPAFETAIGLPPPGGKPVMVRKGDKDDLNAEIKSEGRAQVQYHTEVASMAATYAARAITPDEIAALRRNMLTTVQKGLQEVDQVIMGKKVWSPTQARLFALLTERVLPKLSSIAIEDKSAARKLEDYSLEELEAIAMGKKKAGAVDAVLRQAEALEEVADKFERRETKREVIRELAHIEGVNQGEIAYVAQQVSRPMAAVEADSLKQSLKPQPKFTPEQLENVRAARRKSWEEAWREQGKSEEEIARLKQERIDKIAATKRQLKEERMRRLALQNGLGDAAPIADVIRSAREKTLREFRVHPAKGVRRQSAVLREQQKAQRRQERMQERALNPRIYTTVPIDGVPPEELKTLRLRRLRELRPDLFVSKEALYDAGVRVAEDEA